MSIIICVLLMLLAIRIILNYNEVKYAEDKRRYDLEEQQKIIKRQDEATHYLEKQQELLNAKNELQEICKKWKNNSLYIDLLNVCIEEISQQLEAVADSIDDKQKLYNLSQTVGTINDKHCRGWLMEICPGSSGICINRHLEIPFCKFGYQDLTTQQYRSLTLALGEGLRENYKDKSDIMIETHCYQGSEEFVNRVNVFICEKQKRKELLKKLELQ